MKKVGIMSMQRIANYGSFLQAYALKKMLEEYGCEVQFVDYHPGDTLIPADGGTGIKRKIAKVLEVFKSGAPIKDKIRFVKFKKNYAVNYYPYLGLSDAMNYSPEVDALVIGSDEVFNCVQNNANVGFSPELFGQNNKAKKLITYAASFGNTTVAKLEAHKVSEKVREWLESFDALSVRDGNSRNVVEQLTGIKPECHLDPVLIYDFIGKCKQIPQTVPESGYMLLYGYSGRFSKEECRTIRKYAISKKLKIFCIGGVQHYCDKFIDCDPFSVIAYFLHADCVVTDTFHGTILSVITHRQFISVVRCSGYGNCEKLEDLLSRLGINDRRLDDTKELSSAMKKSIDYDVVDQIIRKKRAESFAYLERQIMDDR